MSVDSSESNCQFVSSRGILKSCAVRSCTPVSSDRRLVIDSFDRILPHSTVYVCTSAVRHFAQCLHLLPCPVILVSGDADEDSPTQVFASKGDFLTFIESPQIIHWFVQNGVIAHPKLSQIPIGIDYHTMAAGATAWGSQSTPDMQEQMLRSIAGNALPLAQRLPKAYANFQFTLSARHGADRFRALQNLAPTLVDYEPRPVSRQTTWANQSHYAFVISPHGNGLDCHRTWEALCLGCIPIVRKSPLDSLYAELPVLIVEDWGEITENRLLDVLADLKNQTFDSKRLTLAYWVERINAKKPGSAANCSEPFSVVPQPASPARIGASSSA